MSIATLDFMMRIDYDMHIVEQQGHASQRLSHGSVHTMAGPETLSHEAVKQALDPARVVLGPEPVALGAEPRVPGLLRPLLDPERPLPGLVAKPAALVQSRASLAHGGARQRRGAL
jgi:hypothetical protein